MPFFTYSQNNSGGSFDVDHEAGISTYVIIEANDVYDANSRAEKIGLYFDGEDDCSCCGNRWHARLVGPGDAEPSIYGSPIASYTGHKWVDGPDIYVHYLNGEFQGVQRVTPPADHIS